MSRLDNKIAIITGGANGFGAAMVKHFVSLGAKVAFGDIATEAGEALAQRLGEDNAMFIPTDVTQRDAVNGLVGGCVQRLESQISSSTTRASRMSTARC